MKHFSRFLALLLAVALLPLTFMAAASAEEPVTITIWGSDRENMPFRNGLWTIDKLQEKLGIKIEIISAPTENLAEKYGLLIASGAFFSLALIIFLLPPLLIMFDRLIVRARRKGKKV